MNTGPDNIERLLAQAGERWRAGQQPPPDVDISASLRAGHPNSSRFLQSTRGWGSRTRVWAPLAAVAGVAAVLAVVVLPVALGRNGGDLTPGDPNPQPPAPTSQGSAAPMEGFGTLLREADGTMKLCAGVSVLTSLPPAGAGCSQVFVLVTGVDEQWLTQEATSHQKWSEPVRVEGSFSNATLAVSRVESFTPDFPVWAEPPIPCQPPAGGWPMGTGLAQPDPNQTAFTALADRVRADPDRFIDVWEGHPDGVPTNEAPARIVYVVGTTGDVAQARAELAAIYPGNLCVHKVAYSTTKLTGIADQLQSVSSTPIQAEALVMENKVRVKVVALDPPTSAILDSVGRDALIIEEPLLKWLD